MGFWGSMFGGQNKTLNQGIQKTGQTGDWASGLGQNLMGDAGNLISSLVKGDPKKTAQLLAPQIGALQKQGQQAKQQMAQFGTRSGGTTAAGQTIDDKARSEISDMISKLTSSAAGQAGQMGQGLVDTGLTALGQQVSMSQQQMANWGNSLFGKTIQRAVLGT